MNRIIDVTPATTTDSIKDAASKLWDASKPWLKVGGAAVAGTAAVGVAYGAVIAVASATYDLLS